MRRSRLLGIIAAGLLITVQLGTAAPVGAVIADAPNACTGVTATTPLSTWVKDAIEPSGDVDWYRFETTSSRHALITLGKLAANYKLELYSSCSSPRLAYSNRSGKQFEEIYKKLTAGTYFVRVSGVSGAHSATQYQLRFRSLADGVTVLSYRTWIDGDRFWFVGELLNNTAQTRDGASGKVRFYDASNQPIGSLIWYDEAAINPMKPRTRSPFGPVYAFLPDGYDHFKITAGVGTPTDDPVIENLTVTAGTPYDEWGRRYYPATLENRNAFAISDSRVTVTLYNSTGAVIQAGQYNPGDIAAGGSEAFEIVIWDHYAGANRLVYQARADKSGT